MCYGGIAAVPIQDLLLREGIWQGKEFGKTRYTYLCRWQSRVILELGRFSQVRKFAELACPQGSSPYHVARLGVSKTHKSRGGGQNADTSPEKVTRKRAGNFKTRIRTDSGQKSFSPTLLKQRHMQSARAPAFQARRPPSRARAAHVRWASP